MCHLKVTVLLFASYREKMRAGSLVLELPEDATVADLAAEMVARKPNLIGDPSSLVIAVNQEYRDHDHRLCDGDEIALIPPVSGGVHD